VLAASTSLASSSVGAVTLVAAVTSTGAEAPVRVAAVANMNALTVSAGAVSFVMTSTASASVLVG
jgi:hypothetical protein